MAAHVQSTTSLEICHQISDTPLSESKLRRPNNLTDAEFEELCSALNVDGFFADLRRVLAEGVQRTERG